MSLKPVVISFFVLNLLFGGKCFAEAESKLEVVPRTSAGGITGFTVDLNSCELTGEDRASCKGRFTQPDSSLILDGKTIPVLKDGNLRFEFPLQPGVNDIEIHGVDPFGKLETETLSFTLSETQLRQKRSFFSTKLGVQNLALQQQLSFHQTSLFFIGGWKYLLHPRHWEISLNATFAGIPIDSSDHSLTAQTIRVEPVVTFSPMWPYLPWRINLNLGFLYSKMLVTNQAFGYQQFYGPQFYPQLLFKIGPIDWLEADGRFIPVSGHATGNLLSNREIQANFGWRHWLKGRVSALLVSSQFSTLSLEGVPSNLKSTTVTLTSGVEF